MKISRDWLSDFVDWIEKDPAVIADRLTRSMGEVDDVVLQGKYLDGVVVGKVTNLRKHPQADRLSVCDVETERGTKKVVCGGTNLREGMHVAFAHAGSTVLAGGKEEVTLATVKIRGEESEGMICAAEEIELASLFPAKPEDGARPIADLTPCQYKTGAPLRTALGMNDVVFHIDNHAITNRPDLFSQIGVARECVALGLAKWKKVKPVPSPRFTKADPGFTLKNDAPDLVTDYSACLITVDSAASTPDWMKRRLEATGWRSINLTVDITNYVLMETGMPLHAFDADDFRGTLHIRRAKAGEKITTLDDAGRTLPADAVVISDDEGIFDLFGVMGGLRTSNKPTTKRIFLQAGVILPQSVRRTMLQMAHRTDAGTVYEKGVTLATAKAGLARAIELFTTLYPGAAVVSKEVTWGSVKAKKAITIDGQAFADLTGADIKPATAKKILTDLGYSVKSAGKNLAVTPPQWRSDVSIREDLVEDVARVYGYAAIKPVMPEAGIAPPKRSHELNLLRDSMKESGFTELLHLAFASPALLKKAGLDPSKAASIENPLGEELSLMRTSLVPSMLETAGREARKAGSAHVKFFEYGRIFVDGSQPSSLCAVIAAKGKTHLKNEPLLLLKADLETAFGAAGYPLSFAKTAGALPPFAHSGRAASIRCGEKTVGLLTEVQPNTAKAFDLPARTAVAIVDLDLIESMAPAVTIFRPLPAFPPVEFDETIALPRSAFGPLAAKLKTLDALLQEVAVADLYESDSSRTITLRFTYRAPDRTLTQQEAEKAHAKVLAELKKA